MALTQEQIDIITKGAIQNKQASTEQKRIQRQTELLTGLTEIANRSKSQPTQRQPLAGGPGQFVTETAAGTAETIKGGAELTKEALGAGFRGEQDPLSTGVQVVGGAAAVATSPITGAIGAAFNQLPEDTQKSISQKFLKVGEDIKQAFGRKLENLREKDPEGAAFIERIAKSDVTKRNLEAILNIVDVAEFGLGTKVARKGLQTVEEVATKPLAKKVTDVFDEKRLMREAKELSERTERALTRKKEALQTYERITPSLNSVKNAQDEYMSKFKRNINDDLIENEVVFGLSPDRTRFATKEQADKLRRVSFNELRKPFLEQLELYRGQQVTTADTLQDEVRSMIKGAGLKPSQEAQAMRQLRNEINSLRMGGIESIETLQADDLKSRFWKTGYGKPLGRNQTVTLSQKVDRFIGSALKDAIEKTTDDPYIRALNFETGKLLSMASYLDTLDNSVIKGGKLGRGTMQLLGAIAGSKLGPAGSIVSSELFAKIGAFLNDVERISEAQIKGLKELGILPGYVKTVEEAKSYAQKVRNQRNNIILLEGPAIRVPPGGFTPRPDTSGPGVPKVPVGAQVDRGLPKLPAGPEGGIITPPYTPPTIIEPRAKKVGTADSVFSAVVGSKSYQKLPKTLQDMEKAIAKKVDDFRREADLMVDRKGAGVTTRNIYDATGNFQFQASGFKLNKAKKQMALRAKENKEEAFKMLMENDPEFRDLVQQRNKKLSELPKPKEIDVDDLAFAGIAGISQDENGNITFDPQKALLGVAGFSVAKKTGLGKALKGKTDDLLKEAKKYKSAEEFAKAHGRTLYRGQETEHFSLDATREKFLPHQKGTAFATTKESAENYGDIMIQGSIPENKILKNTDVDPTKLAKIKKEIADFEYEDYTEGDRFEDVVGELVKIAESKNKEAVEIVSFFPKNKVDDEIRVLDSSTSFKTKQQLTDIWNKANK